MSEIGDLFKDLKSIKTYKKESNKVLSPEILQENDIEFESKNDGIHLIVKHNNHVVDFWPTTGKFIFRDMPIEGRGVFNLIKIIKHKLVRQ